MPSNRTNLILDAQRKAFWLRQQLGLDLFMPMNVFDIAEKRGIDVRFVDAPSMEGIYRHSSKPVILVSSQRPSGRQAFTCAHELGHHEFNHGTQLDQLMEQYSSDSPEEILANAFAGALLMPKTGVTDAFISRGWNYAEPTPKQVYQIACWFGVGYSTLLNHMAYTLRLMVVSREKELGKTTPKAIRKQFLGFEHPNELFVVDEHWTEKPVDVHVGDLLLLPANVRSEAIGDKERVELVDQTATYTLMQAVSPGLGRLAKPEDEWASFVRVTRKGYEGRAVYRHLEDPDEE